MWRIISQKKINVCPKICFVLKNYPHKNKINRLLVLKCFKILNFSKKKNFSVKEAEDVNRRHRRRNVCFVDFNLNLRNDECNRCC